MTVTPALRWLTTTTGYDTIGRPKSVTAPTKPAATITYTPAANASGDTGPLTQSIVTNAAGWSTTSTFQPAWGAVSSSTDQNSKTTTATYDALGRRVAAWLPNHPKAGNPTTPSLAYAYTVSQTTPTSVATTVLHSMSGTTAHTTTTYQLYDGLLRPRQTQATSNMGGAVITDTFYDAAGRVRTVDGSYWASDKTPSGDLWVVPTPQNLPSQTRTVWDGDSRKLSDTLWSDATQRFATTYSYTGDQVLVDSPTGGTDTSTTTDGRGQTTKIKQFHGSTPSGAADTTQYTYDHAGHMATMTDDASDTWRWSYDLLGNVVQAVDPDSGTTVSTYDDANRLTSTTDARQNLLSYSYDNADRMTAQYDGTTASGTQLAGWTYDPTGAVGYPASSTRTTNGQTITETTPTYNDTYQPTQNTLQIPAVGGLTATTYSWTTGYNLDGTTASTVEPAVGPLAGETVNAGYDSLGLPANLNNGTDYFAYSTDRDTLNRPADFYGISNYEVEKTFSWDDGTNRMTGNVYDALTTRATIAANDGYTYDDSGNVTAEKQLSDTTSSVDLQCFGYDYQQQLTQAWTPTTTMSADTTTCVQNPPTKTTVLGGPAPYWQSYTYDTVGNRESITAHPVTASGSTIESDYTYDDPAHAHAVHTIVPTTTAANGTTTVGSTQTYTYDASGNTATRPSGQTLTWDHTGKLTSFKAGTAANAPVQNDYYDASGNLIVQSDTTGTTTAWVGDTELRRASSSTTAERTYSYLGQPVAQRTATGGQTVLTWLYTDVRGTALVAVNDSTGAITHRYSDPFGNNRGATVPWADPHGYLNAPTSALTALTHLGARDYDPTLGRFLSVDSILAPTAPSQNNPYSYAHNNPTSGSDPSGLMTEADGGGNKNCDDACNSNTQFAEDLWEYHAHEGSRPHASVFFHDHDDQPRGNIFDGLAGFFKPLLDASPVAQIDQIFTGKTPADQLYDLLGIDKDSSAYELGSMLAFLVQVYAAGAGLEGAVGTAPDATAGAGDLATSCVNSFTADTPVTFADGTEKPIKDVKVGDKVLAANPETGETKAEPVVALIRHSGEHSMVLVTLADGSVLNSTGGHKIWDATKATFVEADRLAVGDKIETDTGVLITITVLANYSANLTAYNLQIDQIHTYYAGTTPVLVHNSCTSIISDDPYLVKARRRLEATREFSKNLTLSSRSYRPEI